MAAWESIHQAVAYLAKQLQDGVFNALPGPRKLFPVDAQLHEGALMALGPARTEEVQRFFIPRTTLATL